MTQLERQIDAAKRRLWLNRWLGTTCWAIAIAATSFAFVVLIQRLYDAPVPLLGIGGAMLAGAVIASTVWLVVKREDAPTAAAALDEAAGLRERLSSGWFCRGDSDAFARAVVADAERVSASITAHRHIRLTVPRGLGWSLASIFLVAGVLLITPGLLSSGEASELGVVADREQTYVAVKRQMDVVRKLAETMPAIEEFSDQLENLDGGAGGDLKRSDDIRHEAIKKIDKLEDAIRQKRAAANYDTVPQMRKMLRGLRIPKPSDGPTRKLAQALAKGDFKTANEELKALQEQLATLKSDDDREMVAKMSKQLAALAKQLEKLAVDEKLAQKLQQAGIKKEDVERMLERLSKKDVDQLKKMLEKSGLSQKKIEQMVKQLQKRQQAGALAKKLAAGMKKGALAENPGQMGEAMAGLAIAGEQLSELEQLEQEMNQLDAAMASLGEARDTIDRPCPG